MDNPLVGRRKSGRDARETFLRGRLARDNRNILIETTLESKHIKLLVETSTPAVASGHRDASLCGMRALRPARCG